METPLPPLPDQPVQKNNGLALAAGWLGIGSIVMFLLGLGIGFVYPQVTFVCQTVAVLACLTGIILGIVGLVQIKNNPGQKGKGMAITGIVIGGLVVCAAPVIVITTLLILGPVIGNVFSKINSNLVVP
jgi:hypothetical protein